MFYLSSCDVLINPNHIVEIYKDVPEYPEHSWLIYPNRRLNDDIIKKPYVLVTTKSSWYLTEDEYISIKDFL